MVKCFRAKRETGYLGFIVANDNVRTSLFKVAIVKDWPLPDTQKQIQSFMAFSSFYREFIPHFADYSAPLTDLCRKSLPGRVVHCDATMVAFEALKSRMISAPVLLIPKFSKEAKILLRQMRVRSALPGYYFKKTMKVTFDLALTGLESFKMRRL